VPPISTDPDLAKLETDLLALGTGAASDSYAVVVKIAGAVEAGTPLVLSDTEKLAVDRVIEMIPAGPIRTEVQVAAGTLVVGAEAALNADLVGAVKTELGWVLKRIAPLVGAMAS
jgi:hypothetical protein